MTGAGYVTIGSRLAAAIFARRGRGGAPNAEIHLTQAELAAMLALAVEDGWQRGSAAGQGLPTPADVISRRIGR